jgi:hypothetical protein
LNEYHLAEPNVAGEDFLLWLRLLAWLPAARRSGHSQVDELTAGICGDQHINGARATACRKLKSINNA